MAPNLRRVQHSAGLLAITSCLLPADRESASADNLRPHETVSFFYSRPFAVWVYCLTRSWRFCLIAPLTARRKTISLSSAGMWPCMPVNLSHPSLHSQHWPPWGILP